MAASRRSGVASPIRRRSAVHARVGVDEGQILALLGGEAGSVPARHLIHLSIHLSSVRLKLEQFRLPVGDKVVFDRIDALEGLLQRQFLEERQRQNL